MKLSIRIEIPPIDYEAVLKSWMSKQVSSATLPRKAEIIHSSAFCGPCSRLSKVN